MWSKNKYNHKIKFQSYSKFEMLPAFSFVLDNRFILKSRDTDKVFKCSDISWDFIHKGSNIFYIGDGGIGKSLLALNTAKHFEKVFLVDLAYLKSEDDINSVKEEVKNEEILILDSFNENPNTTLINNLLKKFESKKIIIISRNNYRLDDLNQKFNIDYIDREINLQAIQKIMLNEISNLTHLMYLLLPIAETFNKEHRIIYNILDFIVTKPDIAFKKLSKNSKDIQISKVLRYVLERYVLDHTKSDITWKEFKHNLKKQIFTESEINVSNSTWNHLLEIGFIQEYPIKDKYILSEYNFLSSFLQDPKSKSSNAGIFDEVDLILRNIKKDNSLSKQTDIKQDEILIAKLTFETPLNNFIINDKDINKLQFSISTLSEIIPMFLSTRLSFKNISSEQLLILARLFSKKRAMIHLAEKNIFDDKKLDLFERTLRKIINFNYLNKDNLFVLVALLCSFENYVRDIAICCLVTFIKNKYFTIDEIFNITQDNWEYFTDKEKYLLFKTYRSVFKDEFNIASKYKFVNLYSKTATYYEWMENKNYVLNISTENKDENIWELDIFNKDLFDVFATTCTNVSKHNPNGLMHIYKIILEALENFDINFTITKTPYYYFDNSSEWNFEDDKSNIIYILDMHLFNNKHLLKENHKEFFNIRPLLDPFTNPWNLGRYYYSETAKPIFKLHKISHKELMTDEKFSDYVKKKIKIFLRENNYDHTLVAYWGIENNVSLENRMNFNIFKTKSNYLSQKNPSYDSDSLLYEIGVDSMSLSERGKIFTYIDHHDIISSTFSDANHHIIKQKPSNEKQFFGCYVESFYNKKSHRFWFKIMQQKNEICVENFKNVGSINTALPFNKAKTLKTEHAHWKFLKLLATPKHKLTKKKQKLNNWKYINEINK